MPSSINRLLVDRVGNVWVGTDSSGVQKISCLRDVISAVSVGGGRATYSLRPASGGSLRVGGEGFLVVHQHAIAGGDVETALADVPDRTVWDTTKTPRAGPG